MVKSIKTKVEQVTINIFNLENLIPISNLKLHFKVFFNDHVLLHTVPTVNTIVINLHIGTYITALQLLTV